MSSRIKRNEVARVYKFPFTPSFSRWYFDDKPSLTKRPKTHELEIRKLIMEDLTVKEVQHTVSPIIEEKLRDFLVDLLHTPDNFERHTHK